MAQASKKVIRKADQYNDPKHNYQDYWTGREYEHAAEEMAIKRLLKNKKNFRHAVDVGGAGDASARPRLDLTDLPVEREKRALPRVDVLRSHQAGLQVGGRSAERTDHGRSPARSRANAGRGGRGRIGKKVPMTTFAVTGTDLASLSERLHGQPGYCEVRATCRSFR